MFAAGWEWSSPSCERGRMQAGRPGRADADAQRHLPREESLNPVPLYSARQKEERRKDFQSQGQSLPTLPESWVSDYGLRIPASSPSFLIRERTEKARVPRAHWGPPNPAPVWIPSL